MEVGHRPAHASEGQLLKKKTKGGGSEADLSWGKRVFRLKRALLSLMSQKKIAYKDAGFGGSLYMRASTYVIIRSISAQMPPPARAGGRGSPGVPPKGEKVDLSRFWAQSLGTKVQVFKCWSAG